MAYLDKFHILAGETIMECQRIEHDVKLIYAGMKNGNFDKNYEYIKDKALGTVLKELEEVDNSDNKPYISKEDYKLMREIRKIRNWLVHGAYTDFMYDKSDNWEKSVNDTYAKLLEFHDNMKRLGAIVERTRLELLKIFGLL